MSSTDLAPKGSLPRAFPPNSSKGINMNWPVSFCIISFRCFLKLGPHDHESPIFGFKIISSTLISGNSQTMLVSTSTSLKNYWKLIGMHAFGWKTLNKHVFQLLGVHPGFCDKCSIWTFLRKGMKQKAAWCPESKTSYKTYNIPLFGFSHLGLGQEMKCGIIPVWGQTCK